jgi:hypothetical protein
MASKRFKDANPRSKWRQPFSCFIRLEDPETKTNKQRLLAALSRPEAAQKRKKAAGGRRNPLIRLDTEKEIQGF